MRIFECFTAQLRLWRHPIYGRIVPDWHESLHVDLLLSLLDVILESPYEWTPCYLSVREDAFLMRLSRTWTWGCRGRAWHRDCRRPSDWHRHHSSWEGLGPFPGEHSDVPASYLYANTAPFSTKNSTCCVFSSEEWSKLSNSCIENHPTPCSTEQSKPLNLLHHNPAQTRGAAPSLYLCALWRHPTLTSVGRGSNSEARN
jgi:hypothetical protein